jgi:hypothetical protein
MAEKRPLCQYSGSVEELRPGDSPPVGDLAGAVHAAPGKSTPVDTDELALADSENSWSLRKLTWANLKATVKTYLCSLTNWITNGMLRHSAALSVIGRDSNSTGPPGDIVADFNYGVLQRVGNNLAFTFISEPSIGNEAVSLAKMANLAQHCIIGRSSSGPGRPEAIGPASDNYVLMRVDAGSGSKLQFSKIWTDQIFDQAITLDKMAYIDAGTIIGRAINAGRGAPQALVLAQLRDIIGPPEIFHVRDEKNQNTAGGTFTNGAWRTRTLNMIKTNNIGASIFANQFTLPAGTYSCFITCPAYYVDNHQARLQSISGTSITILGTSENAISSAYGSQTISTIRGRFTLSQATVLEVQHQCKSTRNTNGFGAPANFATEVYAEAVFVRDG